MYYQCNQRVNRRHQNPSRKQQQGVVIIVALFVVALVAAMSYGMMMRLMRDTREVTLLTRYTTALFYAEGSIIWAKDQLRNDIIKKKPDRVIDMIPIKSPVDTVNDFRVASVIEDLQARFNLNNLSATDRKEADTFQRLIRLAMPQITQQQATDIVKATMDFISPTGNQNAYATYYAGLPRPYRAAHRLMLHASELKQVKGVTPALYAALEPYIVALPRQTKVNIQTAPALVIAALGPDISLATAEAIVKLRDEKPLTSNGAFYQLDIVKQEKFPTDALTMQSDFFLVKTDVSIEKQTLVLYTVLERSAQSSQPTVTVIWQSKGIW